MATTTSTNAARFDVIKSAVKDVSDATRDKSAAPIPATPEIPKFIDESVNGDELRAMNDNIKGSLLMGSIGGTRVHGMVPITQVTRKAAAGLQVKVIVNGTNGTWRTEEQFFETWTHVIAGIFTIGGKAGAHVASVKDGNTVAVVSPVTNAHGSYFTHVKVDVGGVMGDDAPIMPIQIFVDSFNLTWISTAGEAAKPEHTPMRAPLADAVGSGALGHTIVPTILLTGNETIPFEYMHGLGMIERSGEGRTASWLAQVLAIIVGENQLVHPLMVCLAECAKKAGSDLQGDGPGDAEAAAAGQAVIEAFVTFVTGLSADIILEVKGHEFPGGLLIGRDPIPPGVLGAYVRTFMERVAYYTCAAPPPTPRARTWARAGGHTRAAAARARRAARGRRTPRARTPPGRRAGPLQPSTRAGRNLGRAERPQQGRAWAAGTCRARGNAARAHGHTARGERAHGPGRGPQADRQGPSHHRYGRATTLGGRNGPSGGGRGPRAHTTQRTAPRARMGTPRAASERTPPGEGQRET